MSAALGGPLTAAPVLPDARCQMSVPPAATSVSGQMSTSENGSPSSRNARSTASRSKPAPSATSTVARRPWSATTASNVPSSACSAGMRIQART